MALPRGAVHDNALLLRLVYDKMWGNSTDHSQQFYSSISNTALNVYSNLSIIQLLSIFITNNTQQDDITRGIQTNHDSTFSSVYGLPNTSTYITPTSTSSFSSIPYPITHPQSEHYRSHLSPTSPQPLNPYSTFDTFLPTSYTPNNSSDALDSTDASTYLNNDVLCIQDINNPFNGGTILMAAVLTEQLDVVRFILEVCPQSIFCTHYQSGQSALSYLCARFTEETSLISVEIAQILLSTYFTLFDLSKQSHNTVLNSATFTKLQSQINSSKALGQTQTQPLATIAFNPNNASHPTSNPAALSPTQSNQVKPYSTGLVNVNGAQNKSLGNSTNHLEPEIVVYSTAQGYTTSYDTIGTGIPSSSALAIGFTPTTQQQLTATNMVNTLAHYQNLSTASQLQENSLANLSGSNTINNNQNGVNSSTSGALNHSNTTQQANPQPANTTPGTSSAPINPSVTSLSTLPSQLAKLPAAAVYPFHNTTLPVKSYNAAIPSVLQMGMDQHDGQKGQNGTQLCTNDPIIHSTVQNVITAHFNSSNQSLISSHLKWFIANDLFYSLCILLTAPTTFFHTPTFYMLSLLLTSLATTLSSQDFHFLLFLLYLRPTHATDMTNGPFLSCIDLIWSFWKQSVKKNISSTKNNPAMQSLAMVEHFCSTGFFANNVTLHNMSQELKQILLNNPTNQLMLLNMPNLQQTISPPSLIPQYPQSYQNGPNSTHMTNIYEKLSNNSPSSASNPLNPSNHSLLSSNPSKSPPKFTFPHSPPPPSPTSSSTIPFAPNLMQTQQIPPFPLSAPSNTSLTTSSNTQSISSPPIQLKYPPQLHPTPLVSHVASIKSENFSTTLISPHVNFYASHHTEPFLVPQPCSNDITVGLGNSNAFGPPIAGNSQIVSTKNFLTQNNQFTPIPSSLSLISSKENQSQMAKYGEVSKMSKKDPKDGKMVKNGKNKSTGDTFGMELSTVGEVQSMTGTSSSVFHKRGSIPSLDYQINSKTGEFSRFNSTMGGNQSVIGSASTLQSSTSTSSANVSEKSISRSMIVSVNQSTSRGSIVSLFNSNSPIAISLSDSPLNSPTASPTNKKITSGLHKHLYGNHNIGLGINPSLSKYSTPQIAMMSLAQQLPIISQLSTSPIPFDAYDKSMITPAAIPSTTTSSIDFLSSASVPSIPPRDMDLSTAFRSQRAYITLYFLLLNRTPSTTMVKTILDSISIPHIHQIYDPVHLLFKSSSPKTNATKSILGMLLKKGFVLGSVESIVLSMFHLTNLSVEPNRYWYELQYNYDIISQQQYNLWEHLATLFITSAGFQPTQLNISGQLGITSSTSSANASSAAATASNMGSNSTVLAMTHSSNSNSHSHTHSSLARISQNSVHYAGNPSGYTDTNSNSMSIPERGSFNKNGKNSMLTSLTNHNTGQNLLSNVPIGSNQRDYGVSGRGNATQTQTTWLTHQHFKNILVQLFKSPYTHLSPMITNSNTMGAIGMTIGGNSGVQLNMITSLIHDVMQHANINPTNLTQPQLPITLRPFFYFSIFQHLLYNNAVEISTLRFFLTRLLNNNLTFLPILLFHSLPLIISTCSFDRLIHLVSLLHEVYTQHQQFILSSFNLANSLTQGKNASPQSQTQSLTGQSPYSTYILANWSKNWGFHVKKTNFLFTFITSAQQYATAPLFNTILAVLYPTVTYYDVYDILLCLKQILLYVPAVHPVFNAHNLAHPRQFHQLHSSTLLSTSPTCHNNPTNAVAPHSGPGSNAMLPTSTHTLPTVSTSGSINNLMQTMTAATPSASLTPQMQGRQVLFNRSTTSTAPITPQTASNSSLTRKPSGLISTSTLPANSTLNGSNVNSNTSSLSILSSQSTTTTQQTQVGMDPYTDFSVYLRILVVLEHLYTLSAQSHHFLSTFLHSPLPPETVKQPIVMSSIQLPGQTSAETLPQKVFAGHVSPYLPSSYLLLQQLDTSLDFLTSSNFPTSPVHATQPTFNVHTAQTQTSSSGLPNLSHSSSQHNNGSHNNTMNSHITSPPLFFAQILPHQLTSPTHRSHPQHLSLFQTFITYGYLDQPFAEQLFQCLFQLSYNTEFQTYLPQTTSKMVPATASIQPVTKGRHSIATTASAAFISTSNTSNSLQNAPNAQSQTTQNSQNASHLGPNPPQTASTRTINIHSSSASRSLSVDTHQTSFPAPNMHLLAEDMTVPTLVRDHLITIASIHFPSVYRSQIALLQLHDCCFQHLLTLSNKNNDGGVNQMSNSASSLSGGTGHNQTSSGTLSTSIPGGQIKHKLFITREIIEIIIQNIYIYYTPSLHAVYQLLLTTLQQIFFHNAHLARQNHTISNNSQNACQFCQNNTTRHATSSDTLDVSLDGPTCPELQWLRPINVSFQLPHDPTLIEYLSLLQTYYTQQENLCHQYMYSYMTFLSFLYQQQQRHGSSVYFYPNSNASSIKLQGIKQSPQGPQVGTASNIAQNGSNMSQNGDLKAQQLAQSLQPYHNIDVLITLQQYHQILTLQQQFLTHYQSLQATFEQQLETYLVLTSYPSIPSLLPFQPCLCHNISQATPLSFAQTGSISLNLFLPSSSTHVRSNHYYHPHNASSYTYSNTNNIKTIGLNGNKTIPITNFTHLPPFNPLNSLPIASQSLVEPTQSIKSIFSNTSTTRLLGTTSQSPPNQPKQISAQKKSTIGVQSTLTQSRHPFHIAYNPLSLEYDEYLDINLNHYHSPFYPITDVSTTFTKKTHSPFHHRNHASTKAYSKLLRAHSSIALTGRRGNGSVASNGSSLYANSTQNESLVRSNANDASGENEPYFITSGSDGHYVDHFSPFSTVPKHHPNPTALLTYISTHSMHCLHHPSNQYLSDTNFSTMLSLYQLFSATCNGSFIDIQWVGNNFDIFHTSLITQFEQKIALQDAIFLITAQRLQFSHLYSTNNSGTHIKYTPATLHLTDLLVPSHQHEEYNLPPHPSTVESTVLPSSPQTNTNSSQLYKPSQMGKSSHVTFSASPQIALNYNQNQVTSTIPYIEHIAFENPFLNPQVFIDLSQIFQSSAATFVNPQNNLQYHPTHTVKLLEKLSSGIYPPQLNPSISSDATGGIGIQNVTSSSVTTSSSHQLTSTNSSSNTSSTTSGTCTSLESGVTVDFIPHRGYDGVRPDYMTYYPTQSPSPFASSVCLCGTMNPTSSLTPSTTPSTGTNGIQTKLFVPSTGSHYSSVLPTTYTQYHCPKCVHKHMVTTFYHSKRTPFQLIHIQFKAAFPFHIYLFTILSSLTSSIYHHKSISPLNLHLHSVLTSISTHHPSLHYDFTSPFYFYNTPVTPSTSPNPSQIEYKSKQTPSIQSHFTSTTTSSSTAIPLEPALSATNSSSNPTQSSSSAMSSGQQPTLLLISDHNYYTFEQLFIFERFFHYMTYPGNFFSKLYTKTASTSHQTSPEHLPASYKAQLPGSHGTISASTSAQNGQNNQNKVPKKVHHVVNCNPLYCQCTLSHLKSAINPFICSFSNLTAPHYDPISQLLLKYQCFTPGTNLYSPFHASGGQNNHHVSNLANNAHNDADTSLVENNSNSTVNLNATNGVISGSNGTTGAHSFSSTIIPQFSTKNIPAMIKHENYFSPYSTQILQLLLDLVSTQYVPNRDDPFIVSLVNNTIPPYLYTHTLSEAQTITTNVENTKGHCNAHKFFTNMTNSVQSSSHTQNGHKIGHQLIHSGSNLLKIPTTTYQLEHLEFISYITSHNDQNSQNSQNSTPNVAKSGKIDSKTAILSTLNSILNANNSINTSPFPYFVNDLSPITFSSIIAFPTTPSHNRNISQSDPNDSNDPNSHSTHTNQQSSHGLTDKKKSTPSQTQTSPTLQSFDKLRNIGIPLESIYPTLPFNANTPIITDPHHILVTKLTKLFLSVIYSTPPTQYHELTTIFYNFVHKIMVIPTNTPLQHTLTLLSLQFIQIFLSLGIRIPVITLQPTSTRPLNLIRFLPTPTLSSTTLLYQLIQWSYRLYLSNTVLSTYYLGQNHQDQFIYDGKGCDNENTIQDKSHQISNSNPMHLTSTNLNLNSNMTHSQNIIQNTLSYASIAANLSNLGYALTKSRSLIPPSLLSTAQLNSTPFSPYTPLPASFSVCASSGSPSLHTSLSCLTSATQSISPPLSTNSNSTLLSANLDPLALTNTKISDIFTFHCALPTHTALYTLQIPQQTTNYYPNIATALFYHPNQHIRNFFYGNLHGLAPTNQNMAQNQNGLKGTQIPVPSPYSNVKTLQPQDIANSTRIGTINENTTFNGFNGSNGIHIHTGENDENNVSQLDDTLLPPPPPETSPSKGYYSTQRFDNFDSDGDEITKMTNMLSNATPPSTQSSHITPPPPPPPISQLADDNIALVSSISPLCSFNSLNSLASTNAANDATFHHKSPAPQITLPTSLPVALALNPISPLEAAQTFKSLTDLKYHTRLQRYLYNSVDPSTLLFIQSLSLYDLLHSANSHTANHTDHIASKTDSTYFTNLLQYTQKQLDLVNLTSNRSWLQPFSHSKKSIAGTASSLLPISTKRPSKLPSLVDFAYYSHQTLHLIAQLDKYNLYVYPASFDYHFKPMLSGTGSSAQNGPNGLYSSASMINQHNININMENSTSSGQVGTMVRLGAHTSNNINNTANNINNNGHTNGHTNSSTPISPPIHQMIQSNQSPSNLSYPHPHQSNARRYSRSVAQSPQHKIFNHFFFKLHLFPTHHSFGLLWYIFSTVYKPSYFDLKTFVLNTQNAYFLWDLNVFSQNIMMVALQRNMSQDILFLLLSAHIYHHTTTTPDQLTKQACFVSAPTSQQNHISAATFTRAGSTLHQHQLHSESFANYNNSNFAHSFVFPTSTLTNGPYSSPPPPPPFSQQQQQQQHQQQQPSATAPTIISTPTPNALQPVLQMRSNLSSVPSYSQNYSQGTGSTQSNMDVVEPQQLYKLKRKQKIYYNFLYLHFKQLFALYSSLKIDTSIFPLSSIYGTTCNTHLSSMSATSPTSSSSSWSVFIQISLCTLQSTLNTTSAPSTTSHGGLTPNAQDNKNSNSLHKTQNYSSSQPLSPTTHYNALFYALFQTELYFLLTHRDLLGRRLDDYLIACQMAYSAPLFNAFIVYLYTLIDLFDKQILYPSASQAQYAALNNGMASPSGSVDDQQQSSQQQPSPSGHQNQNNNMIPSSTGINSKKQPMFDHAPAPTPVLNPNQNNNGSILSIPLTLDDFWHFITQRDQV